MFKKICYSVLFIACMLLSGKLMAQPFADEIAAFKKQDSIAFPPKHAILFVGSSSFRKWTDVQQYFPAYTIINRGFGGSSLPDMISYANDIIYPYEPKQIIIYCGENDIAAADTVTAQMVFARFTQLFEDIRLHLPKVPVVYISIKPSPSRWRLRNTMMEANRLIKKYLRKKRKTRFVSVWDAMLDENGEPKKDIFIEDNLHMNAQGYAIWQRIIEPYLKK